MSYHFGTEIAQFILRAYQPGDEMYEFDWGRMQILVDPEKLVVLKDDESSDGWVELPPPAEKVPWVEGVEPVITGFDERHLKALKPVWVIELQCFAEGGLDYEQCEGFIGERMEDWAIEAAKIFKEQRVAVEEADKKTDLLDLLDRDLSRRRQPGDIDGSFYAVFNSYWTGGGGYFDDGADFELEFLGELDKIGVK